ncbi:hypothetical protein [Tautonia marina]|uniref:hypothetical protein n=1 Tax=Tautonia marina TaxID=2653855 RepID=UPI001260F177|nr:hypothetical protein [Tautonia marina]
MLRHLTSIAVMSVLLCSGASGAEYDAVGVVRFSNLQGFLSNLEDVPLIAKQFSEFNGVALQTGSIRPNSVPETVFEDNEIEIIQFEGVQGPNPYFGNRELQIIIGRGGQIHCTWVAEFTIVIDKATALAVFSGDGQFTVVGGTGRYENATGSLQTCFESEPTPLTADSAIATYTQVGTINP